MEKVVEVATMLASLPLALWFEWLLLRALFALMPSVERRSAGKCRSGLLPLLARRAELLRASSPELRR